MTYLPELISISVIAIFMAISPGADFVMITKNSLFHGRKASMFSALGVSLAIWVHVGYSIAGLALIISHSLVLFSIVKYLGAAYLIYIGWQTIRAKKLADLEDSHSDDGMTLSNWAAFQHGFITNMLNPKTTIFFLSIFTQVVNENTPVSIQLIYGAIISFAHLIWFGMVALMLSHPVFLARFQRYKKHIERAVGSVLILFGIKVALSKSPV